MSSYGIVFHVFDENGERTGETQRLATVVDGKVTGRLRRVVEERVLIGVIPIGITGPVERVTLDDPDLVAYAVAQRSGELWDAGITSDGIIVAVDEDGVEIPFRYAKEPPVSDLLGAESQQDVEPIPVD
jgi:hypothetical protein